MDEYPQWFVNAEQKQIIIKTCDDKIGLSYQIVRLPEEVWKSVFEEAE